MTNQDKIAELKKELAKYSASDDLRLQAMKDQQKIKDLKKQIRAKKYGGIVQVGKNLKTIGKGIGKVAVKFIGEDPKQQKGKKLRTVEEVMKDMPQ